jgi:hypothetical protein
VYTNLKYSLGPKISRLLRYEEKTNAATKLYIIISKDIAACSIENGESSKRY